MLGGRLQAVRRVGHAVGARHKFLAPPFLVDSSTPPVYIQRPPDLAAKAAAAERELRHCNACPRRCGVDRIRHADGRGAVCRIGTHARVSYAAPHFTEEPCISGTRGSGNIYFTSCNLRCVFCQNSDVSQPSDRAAGVELQPHQLAHLFLALQNEHRVHNINLVTPEHLVPQVVLALAKAIPKGLRIPVVYNSSAYDAPASLALLDGLVDIYMPDFKFWEASTARRLAHASDYPEAAKRSLVEMQRQVGPLVFSEDGLARRGLLLRHLLMPGLAEEGAAILRWVAQELGTDTFVNIMDQYQPSAFLVGRTRRDGSQRHVDINRSVTDEEIAAVDAAARAAGLHRLHSLWT